MKGQNYRFEKVKITDDKVRRYAAASNLIPSRMEIHNRTLQNATAAHLRKLHIEYDKKVVMHFYSGNDRTKKDIHFRK